MDSQLVKAEDIQKIEEGIQIGNIYFDKRGEEIIRIVDIREVNYRKEPEYAFKGYYYEHLLDCKEDKCGSKYSTGKSLSWHNFKDLHSYY